MVPGNPVAILVNFDGVYPKLDDFYALMWEKFKVDSLHSYGDYGEGCAFAIASAIVIDSLSKFLAKKTTVLSLSSTSGPPAWDCSI